MTRLACQYAIIRFLPYAETGEFANVGVALACPSTGYFDARLMPTKNTRRVTSFFDQLDKRIYRESLRYLSDELTRTRDMLRQNTESNRNSLVRHTFLELTRPREALLRFSETRAVLVSDEEKALEKLFARFVERDFANKEYHDKMLDRGIREILTRANLREYFKAAEIGNELLHVQMPFVHFRDGRPLLAIKPLDLAKDESNQVYDLGGHWVDRIRRLKKHDLLRGEILFAVKQPKSDKTALKAATEIIGELREIGSIHVACPDDFLAITNFAANALKH